MGSVASVRIYFNLATHRDQRLHQALTAYARAQGITLARAGREALEAYLVLGGGGIKRNGLARRHDRGVHRRTPCQPVRCGHGESIGWRRIAGYRQPLKDGYVREAPIEPAGRGNDAAPPHGITVRSGTRGATDLTPACSPYNRPPGTGCPHRWLMSSAMSQAPCGPTLPHPRGTWNAVDPCVAQSEDRVLDHGVPIAVEKPLGDRPMPATCSYRHRTGSTRTTQIPPTDPQEHATPH